ncbi:MAG TPA: O-methyltransferase [Chloroflexota bacterium]|nr:O-methyltransferase [Chloroflexota bacterium]
MAYITEPEIEQYLTDLVPPRDLPLAAVEAEAAARRLPIVGPLEGQFLSILVGSARARRVLELGTAVGYSAIWFGRAVAPRGGTVLTIERDPARAGEARQHLANLGLSGVVTVQEGDAVVVLRQLSDQFDIIFNDLLRSLGDPKLMPWLVDRCVDLVAPGGLIIADNALHAGEVIGTPPSRGAEAVQLYNRLASEDPRLETVVVPIRDGIALSRRRE